MANPGNSHSANAPSFLAKSAVKPGPPLSYTITKLNASGVTVKSGSAPERQVALNLITRKGVPVQVTELKLEMSLQERAGRWELQEGPQPAVPKPPGQIPPGKPGPPPMTGTVSSVENNVVKVSTTGKIIDVPIASVTNADQLARGAQIQGQSNGRWTVITQAKSAPPPVGAVGEIEKVSSERVSINFDGRTVEVAFRELFTAQNRPVAAREIKLHFRVRREAARYVLLNEVQPAPVQWQAPQVQSSYLAATCLSDVFSVQIAAFSELGEYVATKYAAIYYSRAKRNSVSVATYLFQCMLFERLLKLQKVRPTPVCDALGFGEYINNYPSTCPNLRALDFETCFAREIEFINNQIAALFTDKSDIDFAYIAETLKVAIVVVRHSGEIEVAKFFPTGTLGTEWQKLVIVGKPPFPVLITKKLDSLLDRTMEISADVAPFILAKLKFEPPKVDKALAESVAKVEEFDKRLTEMTMNLSVLAQMLLARFGEMRARNEISEEFCSTDIAAELQVLREALKAASTTQLGESLDSLRQQFEAPLTAAWQQFAVLCDYCQEKYRDILFDCHQHGLCKEDLMGFINNMRAVGQVVSPTEDSTSLYCPIPQCGKLLSKHSLQRYDKQVFDRLVYEVDQAAGLADCSQCDRKVPQAIVSTLPCKHFCCFICSNEQTIYCKKCSQEISYLPASMSTVYVQCNCCGSSFTGNLLLPVMCAAMHILCPRCAFSCCRTKVCAYQNCGRAFSASDLGVLRAKSVGYCVYCQSNKTFSEFLETNCGCQICIKCSIDCVRQYNCNFTSCWSCGTQFPQETANLLYERSGMAKELPCLVCGQYGCNVELVCKDKAHANCLLSFAQTQSDQRILCSCGVEVYAEQLFQLAGSREHLPQLAANNPESCTIKCPSCNKEAFQIPSTHNSAQCVTCSECNFNFCVMCQDKWEEFHSQGQCKMTLASQMLLELESKKKVGLQCPYCKFVNEKGLAEWLVCSQCKNESCNECCARKDVIDKHGDSYHRPDCSLHGLAAIGGYLEKCSVCAFFGDDGCPPPPRLARRGRMPLGFSY